MPTDNIKFEYNLQPYGNGGDTTGRRNLDFYKRNLPSMLKNVIGDRKIALDLGCGNGRMNTIIGDYFDRIYCVDPIDELDPKFKLPNVTYHKAHIDDVMDTIETKVDVIIMIGSMHSIWRMHGNATINYLSNMLNDDGIVCSVSDLKHEQDLSAEFEKFERFDRYMFDDNQTSFEVFKKI